MGSNKKKQNSRDKKVFNYWIWLILVGPAVFFAYYWLSSPNPEESQRQKPFLPEKQLEAGESASVNDITLTAAPGGILFFTETLSLGNNRVMAEAGSQFLVIPLVIPEKAGDPATQQWYVTDTGGNRYDLLKVLETNPAGGGTHFEPGRGNRLVHMIFKIKKGNQQYFLVHTTGKEHAAWQFPVRTP